MSIPVASVIIPVFNDENGLQACLSGIARQDYPMDRAEVVVVDNGSNPPVPSLSDFTFRVHVAHCSKPGSYAARNVGARLATGDVLAFTDADCIPDRAWLSAGVRRLLEGRDKVFVGGDVAFVTPVSRSATELYQAVTGFGQERNVRERHFAATANLFCTLHQFEKVGPYDESLLSGGDLEWSWRAAAAGFELCFEPHAVVRTRPRGHLRAAIRQARRVAAGREALQRMSPPGHAATAVRPRSALESLRLILSTDDLNVFQKFRVLCVATVIRTASVLERWRLAFGGTAERR